MVITLTQHKNMHLLQQILFAGSLRNMVGIFVYFMSVITLFPAFLGVCERNNQILAIKYTALLLSLHPFYQGNYAN